MKLLEAITFVRRPDKEGAWDNAAPMEEIANDLDIHNFFDCGTDLIERFKAYPIFNWKCTDEWVGFDAIWLDGEPVGCSYRSGRKMHYEFQWLSPQIVERIRAVILETIEYDNPKILDPMEEVGDTGTVAYVGQALSDKGIYKGKEVTAIEWYDGLYKRSRGRIVGVNSDDKRANCVKVTDGETEMVIPVEQFQIPFNVDLPETVE